MPTLFSTVFYLFCDRLRVGTPSPTFAATAGPHPSHPTMTVFAKISPNPSITPFTNGKNILMDSEEKRAQMRLLAGSVGSNTARVADAAVAGWAAGVVVVVVVRGACKGGSGEWGREGSGNDMEGNDDVGEESTFSHCGESDGAGRVGGAFALVDCGRFCYVCMQHKEGIVRTRGGKKGGKGKDAPVCGTLAANANARLHRCGRAVRGRVRCWCWAGARSRSAALSPTARPPTR